MLQVKALREILLVSSSLVLDVVRTIFTIFMFEVASEAAVLNGLLSVSVDPLPTYVAPLLGRSNIYDTLDKILIFLSTISPVSVVVAAEFISVLLIPLKSSISSLSPPSELLRFVEVAMVPPSEVKNFYCCYRVYRHDGLSELFRLSQQCWL